MEDEIRRIGLSLGADLCWPYCYEEILKRADLRLSIDGRSVRFATERVTIEPFDLQQPCRYDVVLDRVTHWYNTSREWIKKAVIMDGLYVLNNPWSLQSMEKQTTYCAMMNLGMSVPQTWMVPPKEYEPSTDLQLTLERYARFFDLGDIGDALGYPMYMKPYDGGAWVAVNRIDDESALRDAYEKSGKRVMHLQKSVPHDLFVRCVGVGPQVNIIRYDPSQPLHARYQVDEKPIPVSEAEATLLYDMTLTINTFFGWDFNSCEALRNEQGFHPIDFANACPDSQVTSLHFHFPWLVKAMLRWSLFCAATRRKMRRTLDWEPYYAVREQDLPYRDRMAAYGRIAHERLETDRFAEFCHRHLKHLDEVAWEFFGTEEAKTAVRRKVEALYPSHEVDDFTERFWGSIQDWRETRTEPPLVARPSRAAP